MEQVFRSQLPRSANRRLSPIFERVQGSFALFASSCCHVPGFFHPGATLGVLPSEVCPGPQPDTFRLALPCFPFTVRIDLAIVFVGVPPADRLATLRRLVVSRLAGHARVCTQLPSGPVCLHTLGFQGCSREPVRFSGALFKRLPDSHLSWPSLPPGFDSDDLGLDFATPPLTLLPYRAGRAGASGSRSVFTAAGAGASNRSPSSVPSASPSWAFYPRTDACCFESGPRRAHRFTLERGVRHRLAIRSALPGPRFLPERIRCRLSGHW